MVSYEFYTGTFHGDAVPAENWGYYETRAEDQLKEYKRGYTVAEPEPNAESMAVCAMAEALYSIDQIANGNGGPVASAAIGSVRVSYASSVVAGSIDISQKGQSRELMKAAKRYLDIYRGVC